MSRTIFSYATALVLAVGLVPGPAVGQELPPGRQMTLDVDLLYLWRDVPQGIDVSYLENSGLGAVKTLLGSDDLDMGFEPGVRATLGWERDAIDRFEVSGFWIEHASSASVTDPGGGNGVSTTWHTGGELEDIGERHTFRGAFHHAIDYDSKLWNVEANYIRKLATIGRLSPSILVGLRYLNLDEDFQLFSEDVEDPDPDQIGIYEVEVQNKLFGAQIGAQAVYPLSPSVSLAVLGKLGIYANVAEQDTDFFDGVGPNEFETSEDRTGLATVAEFDVTGTYNISENASVSIGYKLMQLSGVAVAPRQFARAATFDSFSQLDTEGSALYHGAFLRGSLRLGAAPAASALASPYSMAGPAAGKLMTVDIDVLAFHRDTPQGIDITADRDSDTTVLSTEDFNLGFEPGVRATVGWEPGARERYELSGFWVEHSSSARVTDPGDDLWPTWGTHTEVKDISSKSFRNAFMNEIDYDTELWNAEANYIRILDPIGRISPSLLAGLRLLVLDEDFQLFSEDEDGTGLYEIDALNRLFGAQVGGQVEYPLSTDVSLAAMGKLGVYANFAEQETNYVDSGTPDGRTACGGPCPTEFETSNDRAKLATVGELGLTATYRVAENFNISIGYMVLYLGGVALAPQQYARAETIDSFSRLDTEGSAIYHGGFMRGTGVF